jgi:hypothetical protein
MLTPYSDIMIRFERKIKEYKEFFCYDNTTDEQFLEIVERRELDLLDDTVNELQLLISINQHIDLTDKDDTLQIFNLELTSIEKDLISDYMIVKLFDEGLIRLKQYQKYFGDDIKMPNSNTERTTYVRVSEHIRSLINKKISSYNARDRKTGSHLMAY